MNASTLLLRLCITCGSTLLLASGCDPKDSSLGDLPGEDSESESASDGESGAAEESDSDGESGAAEESDSDGESGAVDPTDSGGVDTSIVGAPCTLSFVPEAALLDLEPNEVCGDDAYCLYPVNEVPPFGECTADDMCGGEEGQFYCDPDTNTCALNPSYIAAASMCTQTCDTAADCIADDSTTCEGGFSCEPIAALGPLCCQSVCVCNDDLDTTSAEVLRQDCEDGNIPTCG